MASEQESLEELGRDNDYLCHLLGEILDCFDYKSGQVTGTLTVKDQSRLLQALLNASIHLHRKTVADNPDLVDTLKEKVRQDGK